MPELNGIWTVKENMVACFWNCGAETACRVIVNPNSVQESLCWKPFSSKQPDESFDFIRYL